MGVVVGIDLGTTFSAIAVINAEGRAEIIPNREGERITPSVVMFDGDAPIVGTIAKQSAVANPLNVVQFVKRQMGNSAWKFRNDAGDVYTPEQISAIILKRLKEDAETVLNEPVEDAVITVPAYFSDAQRKATQDAGRIAGLNVRRIINEPTAAALAYALDCYRRSVGQSSNASARAAIEQDQTILVYDLGGGTFDVTIMRLSKGHVEVVATGGDRELGGFHWDNEIMMFLNEEFKSRGAPDMFDDPELEQQLRDKAEVAKKTLSSRDKANILLAAGGKTASITLTRDQFDSMTAGLLKRTGNIMEYVLDDAGMKWPEIDKILLTGGSTRMKAVPALIEQLTGKKPSAELHPDEIVAKGAAVQALMLDVQESRQQGTPPQQNFPIVRISDVTAHSLGVVAVDEKREKYNSIILPRNTHYGKMYSGDYETVVDEQEVILLQVTEGEDEDLGFVKIIIEVEIPIPPYPQGAGIQVSIQWDLDGMVHVNVLDQTAGRTLKNINVQRKSNITEEQVQEMRLKLSKQQVN